MSGMRSAPETGGVAALEDVAVREAERVLRQVRGMLIPPWEAERLSSLRSYEVMDSAGEQMYDDLVRLAAAQLGAPVAILSFIDGDRQWGKAVVGVPPVSIPREISICSDVVALDCPVVVQDVQGHPRYQALVAWAAPLVIGSYVGVPIAGRDGLPLGVLCIVDTVPRWNPSADIAALRVLARQAAALLDLRRNESRAGLTPQGSAGDRLVADAHDPRRLRGALFDGEFVPYLQPVHDLVLDRVVGYEALVRWRHPVWGTLTPDRFLPAFESSELIMSLDAVVLDRALAALGRIRRRPGAGDRHVAVNVSGRELTRPGLANRVAGALARHRMNSESLLIEVTETTQTDPQVRRSELLQLREMGVGVLIDDYGSGYANPGALLNTPATGVKIDRSIISRIIHDERARILLSSIAYAATGMGLYVIAEGVEDQATAHAASGCGVRLAQGYAYGRPADEADVG